MLKINFSNAALKEAANYHMSTQADNLPLSFHGPFDSRWPHQGTGREETHQEEWKSPCDGVDSHTPGV